MDVGNPAAFSMTDEILVGEDGRGYFIAALGSVRATLCYPLRDALLFRLEERTDVPAVFADLSRCLYMDSTFIGLLVAIDRKLQKGSGGRLHVVDPSPACLELFRQLGLQEILLVENGGMGMPPLKSLEGPTGRPGARFVLDAHEALMESSDEARRKFGVLRDVLERKLRGEKPRGDTR
jgi:anti-anti-sigma regulatory factor